MIEKANQHIANVSWSFDFCLVASAVVERQQTIKGKVVQVKPLEAETKSKFKSSQNKASSTEKEARTISVSGLPEDVTEKGLLIHFQKKKNRGGDIEKTTLLPGGKALVVFEDPEGKHVLSYHIISF